MATSIDKSTYYIFNNNFRILAATAINGTSITNAVTLSSGALNGLYGSSNGDAPTVTINNGTPATVGQSTLAQNSLNNLIGDINTVITNRGTPTSYSTGQNSAFYANTTYSSEGAVLTPNGTLTFDASGNSAAQFFIFTPSNAITFINPDVSYNLINGAQAENIFWLAQGTNLISFAGGVGVADGVFIATSAITTAASPMSINGYLLARTASISFNGATTSIICYLKGSKILTENGYKVVEDLKEGDLVVSKGQILNNKSYELEEDFLLKPIEWIGKFNIYNFNTDSLPICIQANALGENLPVEDLYVSPGHRILLDGKMICARDLVNGSTIFQDNNNHNIEYYHFELPEHSVVIANGVLTESYLDLDTKSVFDK